MPSKSICPALASTMRFTQRSSVDFPAPDLPMMVTNSPAFTLRLTSESAATSL